MRIICMGAGGLGGFYGALLAGTKNEVGFVARGAHLAAMRAEGLTIERDGGRESLHLPNPRLADNPAELGPADLVILGTKLWDTEAAIAAIEPVMQPGGFVVSLQNGVTKDDALRAAFGPDRVLGGVAYIAAAIAQPGVIRQTGTMQRLVLGGYAPAGQAMAERLAEAATVGGIETVLPPDITVAIWQKFVFLVGMSSMTAAARSSIGPIRQTHLSRAFLADLFAEVVAVGQALGVALPMDEAQAAMTRTDAVPPTMTTSMHHDLERGSRLELPWLAGTVVELGHKAGVATPCARAMLAVLAPFAGGRRPAPLAEV